MGKGRATLNLVGACALLLVAISIFGCIKRVPPAPSWSLTVERVFVTGEQAKPSVDPGPVLRCSGDAQSCRALKEAETLAPAERIRTTQGTQARLSGANQFRLGLGAQSELMLVTSEQTTVELLAGQLSIEGHGNAKASVRFAGHTAMVDGAMPTTAVLRSVEGERIEVTVITGKLAIRDPANSMLELRSGDSVRFARGGAPERGRGTPWLDPERVAGQVATATKPQQLRGLGTMSARIPGTKEVVEGVRLASHSVRVSIRDGLARTEIEETFENTTGRVLEGKYVFQLPPDASVSRLALWVGDRLMEGQVVERKRAATIFRSIVEDTVVPRDPALLEWVKGADVSLKVFPIEAHSRRRLLLAYDQILGMDGTQVDYVYPLASPGGRETSGIKFSADFSLSDSRTDIRDIQTPGYDTHIDASGPNATVHYESERLLPSRDLQLSYRRDLGASPDVLQFASAESTVGGRRVPAEAFILARLKLVPPANQLGGALVGLNRVFVLDVSHSQSIESIERTAAITRGLLQQMDPDEQFAILACESACEGFPEQGLTHVTTTAIQAAIQWLARLAPRGSSDLAGALMSGIRRLGPNGRRQLVYLGDGAPTAGELAAESIAKRVSTVQGAAGLDLRLFGLGISVDELTLGAIANTFGATYQRLASSDAFESLAAQLALELRQPVIVGAKLAPPPGFPEVYPRRLPNLRVGQELLVLGRGTELVAGQLVLSGRMGDTPYELTTAIAPDPNQARQHPLLPRLWAGRRIAELDASADPSDIREATELSRRFRVMSRHAAWLVLESEAMYQEFGLRRRDGASVAASARQPDAAEMATSATLSTTSPSAAAVPTSGGALKLSGGTGASIRPGASGSGLGNLGDSSQSSQLGSSTSGAAARVSGPRGNANVGAADVVEGAIANASRVVAGMRAGFRNCYNRELAMNPDAQGTIRLTINVGVGGEVKSVTAALSGALGSVVECVRARARAAQFDVPEGETPARVVVPITFFKLDSTQSFTPVLPSPTRVYDVPQTDTVSFLPGNEQWRAEGDAELAKLERAVVNASQSRQPHEALIRALLRRGRTGEALAAARDFVQLDPDLALAWRLLAYAAGAVGDFRLAVTSLDQLAELDPRNSGDHLSAARSLLVLGDEPRACAHWRTLAELAPTNEEYYANTLRCRYRLFDERDSVLAEVRAIEHPGAWVTALRSQLESGNPSVVELVPSATAPFKVSVQCDSAATSCPSPLVITPMGAVVSPMTTGSALSTRQSLQLPGLVSGNYRIILMGAGADSRGTVECRILGKLRKYEFSNIAAEHTIASAKVYVVPRDFGWGLGPFGLGRR